MPVKRLILYEDESQLMYELVNLLAQKFQKIDDQQNMYIAHLERNNRNIIKYFETVYGPMFL